MTYTQHNYKYGDLVVLTVDHYNNIRRGAIGIIKNRYDAIANIQFANLSASFPYNQFAPLETLCK